MPLRVRYKANELSEGVVEIIEEANAYTKLEDDTVELEYVDENGERNKVGVLRRFRWDSVIVLEDVETSD